MAGYDLQGARQAGVPDAEIAAALAPKLNYDLDGARKAGVPDAEIVNALVGKFNSTDGGAATGNPNLQRQGDKAIRSGRSIEPLLDIGGAAGISGVMGALAPEIVGGAGRVAGAFPQTRALGTFLENMVPGLRAAGRVAGATQGAISGAAGETAGQAVELAGGPQVVAEGARIVGGGVTPEFARGVAQAAKAIPNLSIFGSKTELARKVAASMNKDVSELSDAERKYLDQQIGELRGGPKSDTAQVAVGDAMAQGADDAVFREQQRLAKANQRLSDVGRVAPVPPAEMDAIGSGLRDPIVKRTAALKDANAAQYAKNEELRNQIVAAKEKAGVLVESTPEFQAMMKDLDLATGATKTARMQTPLDTVGDSGIKSNLNVIRNAVREKSVQVTENEFNDAVAAGLKGHKGTNPQTGEPAFYRDFPTSFEALDNVRRKLGEVFRGKPAEGYDAIGAEQAKKLYAQISDVQKKYAGDIQTKLLDDYARGKEGLEPFISAKGRKATALDKYDDSQFATDASALPGTYFKNRASVQALMELTGDKGIVNRAAMQYVNKKLEGATEAQATKFLRDNADWLQEVPAVRKLIADHSDKLFSRERSVRQATAFADEAAKNQAALVGGRYPADRVRNLVLNGNMDLWEKAGPAIAASPEGKANVLSAVRQVLADSPMDPTKFAERIRPALKGAALADDAALDLIETKLRAIKEMKVPESEKLGIYRRVILQATAGYGASGMARGAVEAAKAVPD